MTMHDLAKIIRKAAKKSDSEKVSKAFDQLATDIFAMLDREERAEAQAEKQIWENDLGQS